MSELPTPEFFYFDLGNVLLMFDHELAIRQIAEVAKVSPEAVRAAVFDSGLEVQYEAGAITSQDFYEEFCKATGSSPDFKALSQAASAIFHPNHSMIPIVAQMKQAGYRLGLLSNTCEAHYQYFGDGRYSMIPDIFDVVALSFEMKLMKPNPKIFERATELAGVAPEKIFFTDDIAGHIEAARRVGWDAVQYTGTPNLVDELRRRGADFNY